MAVSSAVRIFLATLAVLASPCRGDSQNGACSIPSGDIVSDTCASYSTLERLNARIKPQVEDLTRNTDFFSHYRLNLFQTSCPFWDDANGMCGNIGCAVETLDNEEDIPEVWRAHELGKLEGPLAKHPSRKEQKEKPMRPLQGKLGLDVGESCVVEYDDDCDDRDYCVWEDEGVAGKGEYVSLLANPERFTGYSGDSAKMVWDAVYRENCFPKSSAAAMVPDMSKAPISPFGGVSPAHGGGGAAAAAAAFDLKHVLDSAGRKGVLKQVRQARPNTPFVANTGHEQDDMCLEKRVFYKVVSGMHASISTHLCWDFLNQTTGQWTPNLACYRSRLHHFPDRISNMYFNFALLTRAIAKLQPQFDGTGDYVFCTGDAEQDAATRSKVLAVAQTAADESPAVFDESVMFRIGDGPQLKDEFRQRFRNVSRLMDCVGCDKCRLWGKLQTAGYGTALKILFETADDSPLAPPPHLKRTELVALFNTYSRISNSLSNVQKFRAMIKDADAAESGSENPSRVDTASSSSSLTKQRAADPPSSAVAPSPKTSGHKVDNLPPSSPSSPLPSSTPATFEQQLRQELRRTWRIIKYIVRSWLDAPANIFRILISEIVRLWQVYAGLPVNQHIWIFQRRREELNLDEL